MVIPPLVSSQKMRSVSPNIVFCSQCALEREAAAASRQREEAAGLRVGELMQALGAARSALDAQVMTSVLFNIALPVKA